MEQFSMISKSHFDKKTKIPVFEGPNAEKVFFSMALNMLNEIIANNEAEKRTVYIVPVGPVGEYPYFVELVNTFKVSLKNVWFINMDEYLTDEMMWVSSDHPLSFRGFMKRNVYDRILPELVMEESHRVFPDPEHPERIGEIIADLGGVDICFGGLGINGHIAFNEPENVNPKEYAQRPTRVLRIDERTRTVNGIGDLGGRVDDMPHYCITVGMREILSARKIRMYCFRKWHKAVVMRAAFGETDSLFPVTLTQNHPDAAITFAAIPIAD